MPYLNELKSKMEQSFYLFLIKGAISSKTTRGILLSQFGKKIYKWTIEEGSKKELKTVQLKKYLWVKALLNQL